MNLKDEFDNAYSMLCEKLYLKGGVSYKEMQGSSGEADKLQDELLDVKRQVDARLKYLCRTIYKKLKMSPSPC